MPAELAPALRRLSPECAATLLVALAGGDTIVRDVFALLLLIVGIHVPVPNCFVGSGPGC